MRLWTRRHADAFSALTAKFRKEVGHTWIIQTRTTLAVVALAVLALQIFILSRSRSTSGALFFAFVAFYAAWRIWRFASTGGSSRSTIFSSRLLRFPNYLLLCGLLTLGIGVWSWWIPESSSFAKPTGTLLSVPLGASFVFAANFYLGWYVARRAKKRTWIAIAPFWALLFFLGLSHLPESNSLTRFTVELASNRLDEFGVLHLIEATDLHLIDASQTLSFSKPSFFSSYLLLGSICSFASLRRWSMLYCIAMIPLALLVSLSLVPIAILMAGLFESSRIASFLSSDVLVFRAMSLSILLALFTFLACIVKFLIDPIDRAFIRPSSKHNRLSLRWNQMFSVGLGNLMIMTESRALRRTPALDSKTIATFLMQYVKSRSWLLLIPSLFAILTVGWFLGMPGTWGDNHRLTSRIASYSKQLDQRIRRKEFSEARLIAQRLFQSDPNNPEPFFELATAMVDAGEFESGKTLIRSLLIARQSQYQAHLWMARQGLQELSDSKEVAVDIEKHFIAAIESDPRQWEPKYLYALFLASRGRESEATATLSHCQSKNPSNELLTAKLELQLGRGRQAMMRADMLLEELSKVNENQRTLPYFLNIAEVRAFRGDLENASKSLESAMMLGDNASVTESLVRTLITLCKIDASEHQSQRLTRLRRISELDEKHPEMVLLCAQLLFSDDEQVDEETRLFCRKTLRASAEGNRLTPQVCIVLGTGLAQNENFEVAEKYLQQAFERGDRSSSLLNNLAWVIFKSDSSRSAYALELVSQSIEADSGSVDALSTRADILVSLGKTIDAIADLEKVVNLVGPTKRHCLQLADLYDRIDDSKTAQSYRRLSDTLK